MPHAAELIRIFSVRARHLDAHHARTLNAVSFEAAAVAYVEDYHPLDDGDISVIVRDVECGNEHCFRIDIQSGETGPCGGNERFRE